MQVAAKEGSSWPVRLTRWAYRMILAGKGIGQTVEERCLSTAWKMSFIFPDSSDLFLFTMQCKMNEIRDTPRNPSLPLRSVYLLSREGIALRRCCACGPSQRSNCQGQKNLSPSSSESINCIVIIIIRIAIQKKKYSSSPSKPRCWSCVLLRSSFWHQRHYHFHHAHYEEIVCRRIELSRGPLLCSSRRDCL